MKTKQVIKTSDGSGNIIIRTEPNGRSEISNGVKFTILVEQNHRLIFNPGQLYGIISPMVRDEEKAVKEHALFIVGMSPIGEPSDYFREANYTEAQLEWSRKYGDIIYEAKRQRFGYDPNPEAEATPAPEATPVESSELAELRAKLEELEARKSGLESDMEDFELDPDDYEEIFCEWLDEASDVDIPGVRLYASEILREVDYTAYREQLAFFLDGLDKEDDGRYISMKEDLEELEEEISELEEKIEEAEEAEEEAEVEDPNQMHLAFGY